MQKSFFASLTRKSNQIRSILTKLGTSLRPMLRGTRGKFRKSKEIKASKVKINVANEKQKLRIK